jgi:hypothetical protein
MVVNRRTVKAQCHSRGLTRALTPATDAEIVSGIPEGNAAIARRPASQPPELIPPEETSGQALNPCAGYSQQAYRFNPETEQRCSAPLERVVVRRAPVQQTVGPPVAHEPTPQERASLAESEQEHAAMIAPTAIRSA